jgi:hypothetical protein
MTRDQAKQRIAAAILFRLENGLAQPQDALDEILTLLEVLEMVKFDQPPFTSIGASATIEANAIVLRRHPDGSETYGDDYRLVPRENGAGWLVEHRRGEGWALVCEGNEQVCRNTLKQIFG